MACHELSALRLGLMKIAGIEDASEKQHELAELGQHAHKPGVLKNMLESPSISDLLRSYQESLVELQEKVAKMSEEDPKLSYYRSLLITTKKVELELIEKKESLDRMFTDLEEVHDYIHEIYPG